MAINPEDALANLFMRWEIQDGLHNFWCQIAIAALMKLLLRETAILDGIDSVII